MVRIRIRRICNPFRSVKFVGFRGIFAILLGVVSLVSLVLVYQGTRNLTSATYKLRSDISRLETTKKPRSKAVLFKKNTGNNSAACRLPVLDPFHPSVVQFMSDLGKLNCEGVSYSSFENNVLRVEGEDIVSAQYRKIERTPGDDFGVVLADPVTIQNTSESSSAQSGRTGERLSDKCCKMYVCYEVLSCRWMCFCLSLLRSTCTAGK